MSVEWDRKAVAAATRGPDVEQALLDLGIAVAETAAALAPKDSGGGASSIRAEVVRVAGVPEVRVSWDRDHFYMAFAEFGTEDQTATPFLRPAAGRFR